MFARNRLREDFGPFHEAQALLVVTHHQRELEHDGAGVDEVLLEGVDLLIARCEFLSD